MDQNGQYARFSWDVTAILIWSLFEKCRQMRAPCPLILNLSLVSKLNSKNWRYAPRLKCISAKGAQSAISAAVQRPVLKEGVYSRLGQIRCTLQKKEKEKKYIRLPVPGTVSAYPPPNRYYYTQIYAYCETPFAGAELIRGGAWHRHFEWLGTR